ncbi:MAG: ATP-binding cassette domain-containing protein, partial [Spirochaetaceae bacterium]|nr:ATP-binding cassette domain-containing protein [Spirochaetaceae bacterium]
MAFLQLSGVSLAFGDRDILKDVNLNLKSGDKAALCGANGAGKSTLLKIIAGQITAENGSISLEKGCRLAYLPQSGIVSAGKTLYEELESVFERYRLMFERAEALRDELAGLKSGGGESRDGGGGSGGEGGADGGGADGGNGALTERKTEALLAEHDGLFEKLEASGYLRREKQMYRIAQGLGFSTAALERRCEEFSGGWQMRIALAKTLLENADILILDEPTNYLDIEARTWLLKWLKSFSGALLIVSHDRYFLDSLVSAVYELFFGRLKRYTGNYSTYEKIHVQEAESLVARYRVQQAEIEKLQSLIDRFRYKANKAAFAQEQ